MHLGETLIEDTFAEAFRVRYARLIVTAHDDYWLHAGLREATGYATSIIACDTVDAFRASTDPRVADFIEGRAPVKESVETLLSS